MKPRFFSDQPLAQDCATLTGSEAHHLIHVLRLRSGAEIALFDGSGREFDAVVERVARDRVELQLLESRELDRELPFSLTLGVALPKGERQRWLVEKAVELGVSELVPLETQRGVAQPVARAIERLRRAVVEASKQCRRNRLMQISAATSINDYLLPRSDEPSAAVRWIAHPDSRPLGSRIGEAEQEIWQNGIKLAIGPEGGFTPEEIAAAETAGWTTIGLGPRILRVETAAVLLAGIVSQTKCQP